MKNVSLALLCLAAGTQAFESVPTSKISIPELFAPVDVLVVGGTIPAVVAATNAAQNGAKVALVAPRPFLGEDYCETSRYVELARITNAKNPLVARLVKSPEILRQMAPTLPFTYQASQPSNKLHADTPDNSVLRNRKFLNAAVGSVQYDANTDITLTLEHPSAIANVIVYFYQRDDFSIDTFELYAVQPDGSLKFLSRGQNGASGELNFDGPREMQLKADGTIARQFVIKMTLPKGIKRMLLSEICIQDAEMALRQPERNASLPPYPLQIKCELDAELLDNHIQFMTSSTVVEVLKDAQGRPAAVVVANKSGLQMIRAQTIVDATEGSLAAKLAGADFQPFQPGIINATRYVLGGKGVKPAQGTVSPYPHDIQITGAFGRLETKQPVWQYDFQFKLDRLDTDSIMKLEQQARDLSWDKDIVEQTGRLVTNARTRLVSMKANDLAGIQAFQSRNFPNVMVLGDNADIDTPVHDLEKLVTLAAEVGKNAAKLSRQTALSAPVGQDCAISARLVAKPLALPHRFNDSKFASSFAFPVLDTVDVVVVGGGTGGAPAAIAAARHGAKTLLVEYLNELGGTSTVGGIDRYYYGNICGFTKEMDTAIGKVPGTGDWSRITKSEWYRQEILKAGGRIWTSTMVFGAVLDGDHTLAGIAVATPFGPGIVLAHAVVDSTGNSDIAAAAGAAVMDQDSELGVQGTGLSPQRPGDHYLNTDYLFSEDSDIIDVFRSFVLGRERYKKEYDISPIIGSRERRRAVGDHVITPMDIYNKRTYPDTICVSQSNFDSHGYTVHPLFTIQGPDRATCSCDVPLRTLTPKGVDNLLVTGLGISGHRDAMPILRMQPDIQNHGYAAGAAAAMAAIGNTTVAQIDIKKLQKHLIAIGNLPERVLTDTDSYPLSPEKVAAAVASLDEDWSKLATILVSQPIAIPLLQEAYRNAELGDKKLTIALILAMCGDNTGMETLMWTVEHMDNWDQGWNYRGMGQYGPSRSTLDALIIALGNLGRQKLGSLNAQRAQKAIIAQAAKLTKDNEFSHFRAISLALQAIGDKQATPILAALLEQPEMSGHDQPVSSDPRSFAKMRNPDYRRTEELRELFLAAALYRCGDQDGKGKTILQKYANDGRGVYARHAQAILAQ